MNKWIVGGAALTAVAAVATFAVALAVAGSPFDSGDGGAPSRSVTEADEPLSGSELADDGVGASCLPEQEGPCDDMASVPVDGDEEPVTSIDDIDPDECSAVHNIDACEEQAVALAKEDLAARLGISEDEIAFTGSEFVEWPDACLGISKPDIACAQVITPGFRVILSTGLLEYEYHTDMATRVELLEGQAQ